MNGLSESYGSAQDLDGSDGNTSFLRAARNGQLEKVLEYLKSNIDINTSNANGLNALHLASKDGHVDIVEELLKRGAIVDAATKKGNTALHIASLAGQEDVVKLLVQHGASVNVQSQNGFTPLYMAAQENHDNVVKFLLANGANQSLSTEDGFTPLAVAMQQGHDKVVTVLLENDTRGKVRLPALHIAAKKDDVRAAKLLLENEHNPDVTSKSGFTPLHIASHYGNQSIANLLVQKGADVNYAAKHNITPLHVAAKWGKANMVALLLEKGAHIESKTRDGLTPLHCAARSGHEQVVDMLLEKGAPISSKTKNGLAPLHMAAQGDHVDAARILLYHRAPVDEVTVDYLTALHVAAHCGHVRVAKLLLDRQADANARALNGFTPLHIACKKNRIKVVELLLKHGASIGATTESGLTPLHVASFMGCMNIVIYLLQHDAKPDIPTVRGETPLHLAARANQTDIIRILLRNGAQVDARAREQQTPLHIASRLGNVDIVMLLLQHGAQVENTTKDMYTALHIAAKEGQDEVVSVLIENGASLDATTKKGFTPLHLAAKYGHLKVAELLVQKNAPVDAQGKNGVTPLHVAAHYDHQNVALLLLEKNATPGAQAKNGHTPLHIAARKNQMDIANTLLEYGAQPNAESKAGFTPLHLSSQEGHVDMSKLLLEHKAIPSAQSKNGLTPLHLCAQEDRVPVAEILVKHGADIDASTKAGYTPLHIACHYGQINMVKFLLANKANVKSTTSIGYTPLHQGAQQGHTNIVNILLENSAQPNAITMQGQTPLNIAQKLGYITVIDTLKEVTEPNQPTVNSDEKYKVVAPEMMHETFLSDSEEEGEDTILGDQTYRYLTADEMKSLGDDSLPIDVTRDEKIDSNKMVQSDDSGFYTTRNIEESISPEHIHSNYMEYIKSRTPDNIDVGKQTISAGFLVSFLVDARGGAMRGCRHSGVKVIVPPRCAPSPTRITCRYVRPQRTPHPPPLMEGEALASRVLELGPTGAKFLGPVIIEVPHFAALRGKEREIVILRSDNGENWKEHHIEASEDIINGVLRDTFNDEDFNQLEDVSNGRITRIVTQDIPQYFAVVSRVRQEVHAIGPEGGMVSSTVVPQVQAVFPQGALTKKIKVGLQVQPIEPELTAKLLGHGVAVSPVVTVEPRRRKFHKAITLSMPAPRAHSQGMINQYSGSAPTLRLLCSITGGTSRAQWEDVTGSTPLTFINDCVSFTTTVSARFWLMDCRNIGDATKMATELYREAIHVPFIAKFVVFAKRIDPLEARLRVFCMTDDKEDKTLEYQEQFTEVAKSRDVEVLEGKSQYVEFAGNLVPITKSGEQLQFSFRAFRENRLPFSVRVKDQHAEAVGRSLFMREPKVQKGEPPQQPICILNIVLPDDIVTDTISLTDSEIIRKKYYTSENFDYYRQDPRLADISNLLGDDWVSLANQLGLTSSEINVIKAEYPESVVKQAQCMLRMWLSQSDNKAQTNNLENALRIINRSDIVINCLSENRNQDVIKMKLDDTFRVKDNVLDEMDQKKIHLEDNENKKRKSDDKKLKMDTFDKYSAEEKVLEPSDEEEDFNKSVPERREQIVKRLSVERTIPASTQRVEIAQEINTIKRQSLVEDKIAEVQQKVAVSTEIPKTKIIKTSPESALISEKEETTILTSDLSQNSDVTQERRDSTLVEEVTHLLETKKPISRLLSEEDPKSPKFSKTPPPSPADFTIKDKSQAASVQEWTSNKSIKEELETTQVNESEEPPKLTNNTTNQPQPKPRLQKLDSKNENEPIRPLSPVRDDLLDEEKKQEKISYSEKKLFWETKTKETSLIKEETYLKKSKSVQEPDSAPVPKPRTVLQSSLSVADSSSDITSFSDFEDIENKDLNIDQTTKIDETISDDKDQELLEDVNTQNLTEYQAAFNVPTKKPTKTSEITLKKSSSSDSNTEVENAGYISDCEDVEQNISDSEIEDRVPQIKERHMSVCCETFGRKNIYERSSSLPTEDLYDVYAKSAILRKHYEEQIKKGIIQEQLTIDSEEDLSPEKKHFDDPDTRKTIEPLNLISTISEKQEPLIENNEEIDNDLKVTEKCQREISNEIIAEELISTEDNKYSEEDQTNQKSSKNIDFKDIHVDKSETERSEKLADNTKNPDLTPSTLEKEPSAISPMVEDNIPEITITLSGKQRRISEESDEYADNDAQTSAKTSDKQVIQHSEENIEDVIWEVSIESEQVNEEKVSSLPMVQEPQIPQSTDNDNDISSSIADESELTSDKPRDFSDTPKYDTHMEIKNIIFESLNQRKVDPEEAKKIANALMEEIEAEIQKVDTLEDSKDVVKEPVKKTEGSNYLRELAAAKGLNEREVELVQSVLARKQRKLSKLTSADTQASSMEITDEDLRFSGSEMDYPNILEQQIGQLEAEGTENYKTEYNSFVDDLTSHQNTNLHSESAMQNEKHFSFDNQFHDDKGTVYQRRDNKIKSSENVISDLAYKETKDIIFEEDEVLLESVSEEMEKDTINLKTDSQQYTETVSSDKKVVDDVLTSTDYSLDSQCKKVSTQQTSQTDNILKDNIKLTEELEQHEKIENSEEIIKTIESDERLIDSKISSNIVNTEDIKATQDFDVQRTIETVKGDNFQTDSILEKTVSKNETVTKTVTVLKTEEKINEIIRADLESIEKPDIANVDSSQVEKMNRTSSSDSKSSADSRKSNEDIFSTCSSGAKGVVDQTKTLLENKEVTFRKPRSVDNLKKGNRLSGIEIEAYSSSGESHYQSFELDSGKSRPCSSDIEGLLPVGSSEYESALTSQEVSSRSQVTSGDYHTAVSSMSSKESIKSLDSESSGNLGSIEVSEASETLVPSSSDIEGDMIDIEQHIFDDAIFGPNSKMLDFKVDLESNIEFDESHNIDIAPKMKRSCEMTFQPEPKPLRVESPPKDETEEKFGTSLDDGSVLSVSMSSTSSAQMQTIIENALNKEATITESEIISTENLSQQTDLISSVSLEGDSATESVLLLTSNIIENGASSASTQVSTGVNESSLNEKENAKISYDELKKRGHRRQDSTIIKNITQITSSGSGESDESEIIIDDKVKEKSDIDLINSEAISEEDEDLYQNEINTDVLLTNSYNVGMIPDITITQHRIKGHSIESQDSDVTDESAKPTEVAQTYNSTTEVAEPTDIVKNVEVISSEAKETSKKLVEEVKVEEIPKKTERELDSPNSDSFELLEKPDIIEDFVVIEEVGKEANEFDSEGKSVKIDRNSKKIAKKHDDEIDNYLAKSDPTPLTKLTALRYYPDGSSSDELGFEFDDSPPQAKNQKESKDYSVEYNKELEANKKWIEQQFQGDQSAIAAAGYGYEMEFERGPLEDIKEEDINDLDLLSSRVGSLSSQKESGGSLGSVKDSYSSTPEYDVLAGKKYFTKSNEHDDISMSSLQEFENLEKAMSLESKRFHHGSHDSSSNGSLKTKYSKGHSDEVSASSLKEFEGLEKACIQAYKTEIKIKEEEAMLSQIEEGLESIASEESCETVSVEKKHTESEDDDSEKRMFEINQIIKQAQSNVEKFTDFKENTESLGRGDSFEEVSKVPDLDLDAPLLKNRQQQNQNKDPMEISTDSLDLQAKVPHDGSEDSLNQKAVQDVMTASIDSIELAQSRTMEDSFDNRMMASDSLELSAIARSSLSDSSHDQTSTLKELTQIQQKNQGDLMAGSSDSLATSSAATHATYQYESDSVFSGSFTSGGSNTMVSSTDTIEQQVNQGVDINKAINKVWMEAGDDTYGKPYVTEIIEPANEEGFSHIIHRTVEMPAEVKKYTFQGPDAEKQMQEFLKAFEEGEKIEEFEEVDGTGNVHLTKIVQKRYTVTNPEEVRIAEHERRTGGIDDFKFGSTNNTNKTDSSLLEDKCFRDDATVPKTEDDLQSKDTTDAASSSRSTDHLWQPADQHQLSEEMKELLKEMEKTSKS